MVLMPCVHRRMPGLCSTSPARAGALHHVPDIGCESRKSVDHLGQLSCRDAALHCKCKDVDQLFAGMADQMSPEDPACRILDDDLRPCHRLRVSPGGEPALHVVQVDVDGETTFPGLRLGQTDGCHGRYAVERRRYVTVVGPMLRAVDDIAAAAPAFISRNR